MEQKRYTPPPTEDLEELRSLRIPKEWAEDMHGFAYLTGLTESQVHRMWLAKGRYEWLKDPDPIFERAQQVLGGMGVEWPEELRWEDDGERPILHAWAFVHHLLEAVQADERWSHLSEEEAFHILKVRFRKAWENGA